MKQLKRVFTDYGLQLDTYDAEEILVYFEKYVKKSLRLRGMKDYTVYEKEDFNDEFIVELFKKNNTGLEVVDAQKFAQKIYQEEEIDFPMKEIVSHCKIVLDTNDYRPSFYSYRRGVVEIIDNLKKNGHWGKTEEWLLDKMGEANRLSILFDLKKRDEMYITGVREIVNQTSEDIYKKNFFENLKKDITDAIQEWIEEHKKIKK